MRTIVRAMVAAVLVVAGLGTAAAQERRAASAAAPVTAADLAAVRARVVAFFGAYRHIEMRPGVGKVSRTPDEPSQDGLLTAGTAAIAAENSRLLLGEAGDIDSDIFLDAQDHGTVRVTSVTVTPRPDGRITSLVVFDDAENKIRGHRKTIIWERTPAGWRVYDVLLAGQGSYRAVMLAENRRLRQAQHPAAPTAPGHRGAGLPARQGRPRRR